MDGRTFWRNGHWRDEGRDGPRERRMKGDREGG